MHAFLDGRLGFLGIAEVIAGTLDRLGAARVHSFDSLSAADQAARETAAVPKRDGVAGLRQRAIP